MASARPSKLPFTPQRPVSTASMASSHSSTSTSTTTSNLLNVTKKYRAPISTESRSRTISKPRPASSVPSTPLRKTHDLPRPKTPNTPRARDTDSPFLRPLSSMDVRNVDPEDAVVDFLTLDPGDISVEVDESFVHNVTDHGGKDKVLVSIRMRPTNAEVAWQSMTFPSKGLKLFPQHAKSSASSPQEFHFDEVLTGSDNKPVYNAVARSHVTAAMEGYNAVVFAYGQTASGKTFTLSGDDDQPGIIPRAMRDIFAHIRRTPSREYLLRCSYLEIYNENIHDLLAPPSAAVSQPVQIQGSGNDVILSSLREEVVTSLKEMKEVIARGEGNRRTASTDWNERSSRSHSVFRVVIESRERGDGAASSSGRQTPGMVPPTPGGPRLQAIGGRSVQTSVLSLIDLAGSEKATSDKERTREGKYINTSLLTLGSVISTLADNAAKKKNEHVPFRNSKLTRMLQPSLSGDARISVVCTINPDTNAVAESTSTLLFAQRIKKVALNAKKKEVVDTDALLERYRREIEDLKSRLAEREGDAPVRNRRLSARQQLDETKAMKDLNNRIQQLTKLILTSQTVDETQGDKSRPASPLKVDFDMSPYQLQQELLAARRELETSRTQILSLEAALMTRPALPVDAPENEKDKLIADQGRTIRELEIAIEGYEQNLGEPLRAVREDVEKEWAVKFDVAVKAREEKEAWAELLVQQLEKEKRARTQLEDERRALAAFVSKFDALGLGGLMAEVASTPPSKLRAPMPSTGGAQRIFDERQHSRIGSLTLPSIEDASPARPEMGRAFVAQPSLLMEERLDEVQGDWTGVDDISFDLASKWAAIKAADDMAGRDVFGSRENLPA